MVSDCPYDNANFGVASSSAKLSIFTAHSQRMSAKNYLKQLLRQKQFLNEFRERPPHFPFDELKKSGVIKKESNPASLCTQELYTQKAYIIQLQRLIIIPAEN